MCDSDTFEIIDLKKIMNQTKADKTNKREKCAYAIQNSRFYSQRKWKEEKTA